MFDRQIAERFQLHSTSVGYGYDRATTVSVGSSQPHIPHVVLKDLVPVICPWECAALGELPGTSSGIIQ